jgi:hypothetical protein
MEARDAEFAQELSDYLGPRKLEDAKTQEWINHLEYLQKHEKLQGPINIYLKEFAKFAMLCSWIRGQQNSSAVLDRFRLDITRSLAAIPAQCPEVAELRIQESICSEKYDVSLRKENVGYPGWCSAT